MKVWDVPIKEGDQNNTLSKPRRILQNTRAWADNENNTITERTGKVKTREVEARA